MAIMDRLNKFCSDTQFAASSGGQVGDIINLGTVSGVAQDQIVEVLVNSNACVDGTSYAAGLQLEDCDTEGGTYRKLQEIVPLNLTGISDTGANLKAAFPAGSKLRVLVPSRARQFIRIASLHTTNRPVINITARLASFMGNM